MTIFGRVCKVDLDNPWSLQYLKHSNIAKASTSLLYICHFGVLQRVLACANCDWTILVEYGFGASRIATHSTLGDNLLNLILSNVVAVHGRKFKVCPASLTLPYDEMGCMSSSNNMRPWHLKNKTEWLQLRRDCTHVWGHISEEHSIWRLLGFVRRRSDNND